MKIAGPWLEDEHEKGSWWRRVVENDELGLPDAELAFVEELMGKIYATICEYPDDDCGGIGFVHPSFSDAFAAVDAELIRRGWRLLP